MKNESGKRLNLPRPRSSVTAQESRRASEKSFNALCELIAPLLGFKLWTKAKYFKRLSLLTVGKFDELQTGIILKENTKQIDTEAVFRSLIHL